MPIKLQESLARNGNEYYKEIVKTFGQEILREDFEINREKLAGIVFFDKNKKEELDKITYKYVVPKIIEEANSTSTFEFSVIDVPLLFETNLDKVCDKTIGVIADRNACVERIMKRDNIDKKTAIARIDNQNKENFFKEKCNYCIFNNNENDLEYQIQDIFNRT